MIYLFNQTEELIDVIDEASLADFTHTIELNQFDRASFEIPVDYKPNIIKEAQFFGFQSRDRAFCLFRISEKSYDIGLTIQGIDRAESDLHSFIIEDKRPGGTASDVLREILKGTGYHLGNVDGLTINGNMSFYYISVRQALVKLIESYACEFKIRYTFVENKIIGRYIDLNQRFGRKTGHQFEYGSNILNVTYEESSDEVVTALIGRGKGEQSTNESGEATGGYGRRIQFKDVVWSVSKGDPVDKPAGQNYVANEAARNIYGLHQNGVIKHRFGVYTNEDIEDPVELLKATYKELKRLSVPIVTFKANLLDLANAIEQDIWIGDSVGIVRDQIGIAFEARIHKLIIDKLDDNRSVVELGDYQTLQAKDRSTRQQAIKDAVSGFSEGLIEEAIANEVDRQNKEFDEKIRVNKLEFDNELQRAKERAEEVKRQISDEIDKKFQSFDNAAINEARQKAEEALRNAGASSLLAQEAKQIGLDSVARLEAFKSQTTSAQTALSGDLDALKLTVTSEVNQASEYRRTTTEALSRMTGQMNGFATKSEVAQGIDGLAQTFAKMRVGGRNLLRGSKGPFLPDRKPANFDNNILYVGNTSIYMEQGQEYTISAKTDGNFTAHHDGNKESDNVVLWIMDKNVRNYQIVSDLKTGTAGTKIIWNKPTGIYHLRVNTYHKEATKSVWDVKIEKGNVATDWSPAPEDTDGLITEAKATFERTAQGLRTDLSGIQEYVNKDGQRQEALQRYTREESAKQATAVRELVEKDYVGKATYQETVKAIEHKFEAITNPQNGSIATQIATYKNAVDGRFADITSLISGKANQTDFQRVKETSQLYERILGNTENGIADKVARMAMTNQLFQVEVSKNENLKTVQRQLAGSWGVHNKNSVNEIIAGFNLAGRNAGIKAETIRLEGNTLADKLTAIDGYFKRLFVGEGTFATLNTDVIRTNSITADKLVFNEALANRMVSNEIITSKLVASRAFVNALKAVTIDASQIVTGTLKGDRIYGGTIRGTEINGTTITGNSRMTIGDNGFLRPTQEGGLQINVPETYSASKGVGVQLLGRELGRIPKGMFIYNSPNWNGGNIIGDNTEDILLTVKGRVSLCNLHNGSPVSGVPIISNFEYQNPIRNLYPIRFIGWDPRSNQLYVDDGTGKSGTWWISVDGSTSDKNLKTNIGDTHYNALDFVQKLMFKEFDWKTDKFGYKKPYTNVGLIAQDVEKIDSSLVYKKGETLALDDFRLLNIALKAIQELSQRIETLERKLA